MTGTYSSLARRMPVSFFPIVMGLGGLGLAWRAATRTHAGLAPIGDALVLAAALLWILLTASYIAKWVIAPGVARSEAAHPLSGAFVPLVPASLLLLLPALVPWLGAAGGALFIALVAAQIATTAVFLARCLGGRLEPAAITPAWHLAVVAGLLFSSGAAAALGFNLTAWCFFGAGALAWLAIDSLVLHRLATQGPLAPPMRPLLAIELAAPAVVLITYTALADGEADALALGLFGWTLFVAVMLSALARWLCEAPFGAEYWAFTFPAAALSIAAWRVAQATAADPALRFALVLFVVANAVIGFVAVRTLLALGRGRFLPA